MANINEMRSEFRKLRRKALYAMSRAEFDAKIAAAKPKSPEDFVRAAEAVRTECGNCHGSGVYSWGACVNGRMTHSGPCFRCEGKGYQDQADFGRNWAYDNHRIVAAFHAAA